MDAGEMGENIPPSNSGEDSLPPQPPRKRAIPGPLNKGPGSARWRLGQAASKGLTDVARDILEEGGFQLLTRTNSESEALMDSPLHLAASAGHSDTTKLLVDWGFDPSAVGYNQDTPLHVATRGGHTETARVLLERGANVNATNRSLAGTSLHIAALWPDADLCELLVAGGADIGMANSNDDTALHIATRVGNTQTSKVLVWGGGDVNLRNGRGERPLTLAAKTGNLDIAHFLLDNGALTHLTNAPGDTPLHVACAHTHLPLIRELLTRGASPQPLNERKETALHLLIAPATSPDPEYVGVVEQLLQNGADPCIFNASQENSVHVAAKGNSVDLLRVLLDHGGDAYTADGKGWTPLHYACSTGDINHDITSLLLYHCADANTPTPDGDCPLHLVCEYIGDLENCSKVVEELLKAGADAERANSRHQTPLIMALIRDFLMHRDNDGNTKRPTAVIRTIVDAGVDMLSLETGHAW